MKVSNAAKRYLYILFGCIVGMMAINTTVVSVVDPMGYLCTYESAGINKKRY